MASTQRAPKQWCLTKVETVTSFESWRQNILYTLSLDQNFAPFLRPGVQWQKKNKTDPCRGFDDDGADVLEARRRTKEQKVSMLELMLGQIANFCPIISRNTIVKTSTSTDSIWQAIRLHFGFQSTGSHFIDFASIHLDPDERPEDLYQRLMAFVEDNLVTKDSGITHHDLPADDDEEMTPSLENFIVLTWLRLIHTDLPKLVKQRYGTELRSRTLASIKPEISQALSSLLEELHTSENAKALKTAIFNSPRKRTSSSPRSCPLCKSAGRPYNHFLSKCTFLPSSDRKYLAKARQIVGVEDVYDESDEEDILPTEDASSAVHRVQIQQSPYINAFYRHNSVKLTIDSGATGNMIKSSVAQQLRVPISDTTQSAHQADGLSPLHVVGETRFSLSRGSHELYFEGLVVDNLDTQILAGIPFMVKNDISIRPSRHQITIGDNTLCNYSTHRDTGKHAVRRAQVLRVPTRTTVWPGEYIELDLPDELQKADGTLAIEPRHDNIASDKECWPPLSLISSVSGKLRIPNLTTAPLTLKRNEHICTVRSTFCPEEENASVQVQAITKDQPSCGPPHVPHSSNVSIDPDNVLSDNMRDKFQQLVSEFDSVFNPAIKGYNGAVGPFQAHVNMGPVQPPQRKGRVPQYARTQLELLQDKFDELERVGVFRRPEDVGVHVEYVNPSFLVKKPNGDHRLVTAFADVGRYSKPQPSLMPDVESTLRLIGQWKYLIVTDLTKSFYQIPLSKESMKYCGVVTPFRGTRVYARSAMGMPGSETALEELTCRVLGDLVRDNIVAKVADDLYCGGNTPEELLLNWRKVLQALHACDLCLSAAKTVIAPKQTTILGWVWRLGSIQASPHRIATLSSCEPPATISGMRSFIGAYKVLSRVVKGTSTLLSPLEQAVSSRDSKDRFVWTEELYTAFYKAQKALSSNTSITLPRPEDILWIVTDGAQRSCGLGATLYVSRRESVLLAGFFSAKLRAGQKLWLPCEVEALSIAASVKHFCPYIIQSSSPVCVLTDSKPCVQAFEKLCRGEFSASPRVSTFLSTASRYRVSIKHIAGASILPSDFASRNAPDCEDPTCQICSFIHMSAVSVVRTISAQDILSDREKLPFTSRTAWLAIQSECPDLRRTHAHLKQGTRPSKKLTNIKDVKRYLNVASIAADGLVVVKRQDPFVHRRDCIVVPRNVLDGLITSMHIKLDHPSSHQLKTVLKRHFYALDFDRAVDNATDSCYTCASLRRVPHVQHEQTSSEPPASVGISFAADVIKRERQLILVVRECVTSYTMTMLLEDERKDTLRSALLQLCAGMLPLDGPFAVVRTDPAPGFSALSKDDLLKQHRLSVEVGRVKNINKNPVAERAVQELEDEILRQDPGCRVVSRLSLALATARLNTRIRSRGFSAREMILQRDQFYNNQLPMHDGDIILHQHESRAANHLYSQMSKGKGAPLPVLPSVHVGDLVFLFCDRDKSRARDRYLVTSCEGEWCNIRKFVGSQLRSASYRVKRSDCYKVPRFMYSPNPQQDMQSSDSEENDSSTVTNEIPTPSVPVPMVPEIISAPPADSNISSESTPALDICPEPPESVDNNLPPVSETKVKPSRTRKTPKRLDDYVLYCVHCNSDCVFNYGAE